ncbi:putative Ig domain-containing protein [Pontiella sulfatireligans]|uniref:Alpha-galactosidase n=1 Tax=Pontiella sulfatireligans TaxID=2750658 RepID=A0A6C2UK92_9BACT|nr:putative Ig domain-containing protein [Pontiella sulfatireligans]VGO20652.1 Alpha-galactosidase A [Pontiella sulfatireligans]
MANAINTIYEPECGTGKYILTPPEPLFPRINGASVFGVRMGSPFLYTIPATGERPLHFSAEGLPEGLQLNAASGIISGAIADRSHREHPVVLRAKNAHGEAEKKFTVVVGGTICLTPPMGWNSWNCWKVLVDQDKVLASARAMVDKGLINHGWSYVNIDDAWQGRRGGKYNAIQPDPSAFSDIGKVCDEIHAMGLKTGIYSSPWITTYAGRIGGSSDDSNGQWNAAVMAPAKMPEKKAFQRVGAYVFDENDAAQWAEWGIDYLKYDWKPNDPESTLRMADALKSCGRDIVYSLSNTAPLEHAELYGREVNCWRTAGDLKDRWDQKGPHLNLREQWELHRTWIEEGVRGGPGHFPDADMLVVGDVSTSHEGELAPTNLTADEQYAHISLWILWACPLLIGCPIDTLDAFTLNLLTNAEVLDVHQDAVAVSGKSVRAADGNEIIVKDLADGGKAVGLFNLNAEPAVVELNWKGAGLRGPKTIRDLWRQKDVGVFENTFATRVQPNGVVLIRAT